MEGSSNVFDYLNEKKEKEKGGLPGFENLSPDEQNKKLIQMFREVFGSSHGKIVLTVLLEDLYFFRPAKNEEDMALSNYAKTLLMARLGLNDNKKIVDKLFETE